MATNKNNDAAQDAAKKALAAVQAKKAAEKKKVEHTITHVGQESTSTEELLAITKKNAAPYRIGAVVLWLLAIGFEILAILFFKCVIQFSFTMEKPGWYASWIICLVLDLICVVIGSLLWKKGNHLDPKSAKNKLTFWLHNNLGLVMAALAFFPFIIVVLTDKNAQKQSKIIAVAAAVVALIIAGLTGYDWNPISQEELLESAGVGDHVYWTESGTVYHAFEDCSHLNHSKELFEGTSTTAIEQGKTRICKTCEQRAEKEAAKVDTTVTDVEQTPVE
ncbi:MAG: hypothetical protein J5585_08140 [Clostridia bacterium]|nr:hypothetical protein [Clostridia bacterium]